MKDRNLIVKMLDILVEMAEHCNNKEKPENTVKCCGCAMAWDFGLCSHGCFLVNTVENSEFIDDLINVCIEHKIDYQDKLNKIASIFQTCY